MNDCPCCGFAVCSDKRELCEDCEKAECDEKGLEPCNVPFCGACATPMSWDEGSNEWVSNCDDEDGHQSMQGLGDE